MNRVHLAGISQDPKFINRLKAISEEFEFNSLYFNYICFMKGMVITAKTQTEYNFLSNHRIFTLLYSSN